MPLFGKPRRISELATKRDVKGLIKALKHRDSSLDRQRSAEALGKLGDARAVKPLIAALEDESDDVCIAATEALGKLGDTRTVGPLVALLEDESNKVFHAAAEALGKLGDARAVKPLIAALEDEDRFVRDSAAKALIKIGSSAVKPLITVLNNKSNSGRLVNEIRGGRVTPVAINARASAATILGQIGDTQAAEPLVAALRDRSSVVRKAAAEGINRLPRLGLRDENLLFYWIAMERWKECSGFGVAAVEPLIGVLGDGNSSVRAGAAETLGKTGDSRAVEPLIALLEDSDNGVRFIAAGALSRMYDSNEFTAELKNAIFGQREAIQKQHRDAHEDFWVDSRCQNAGHNDKHTDLSHSLNFPL